MNIPQMCPRFEKAMELLSKRWTVLIVFQLTNGPQRFVAIENSIPNLWKGPFDRLKELEEEGIIQRMVYPEKPVRIEYSLTDKGRDLAPLFDHIGTWATRWIEVLPALEQQ